MCQHCYPWIFQPISYIAPARSTLLSLDLSADIIYSSSNVTQSCVNIAIVGPFRGYYIFLQQCHPIMCQHCYPWNFQPILYIPPAMSANHVSTLLSLDLSVDNIYSSRNVTRSCVSTDIFSLSVDIIYSSSNVTQSCVNIAINGPFRGYYIFLQQCHPIMCQRCYHWTFQWILYLYSSSNVTQSCVNTDMPGCFSWYFIIL